MRLLNGAFQQSVARHAGGVEVLLAIGFVERESLEEEDASVLYVLEEPSLEDDFDGWSAWFDGVKAGRDRLLEAMGALGVRPRPAASKGLGWNEAAPRPPRAEMADCLTLHGQRGGGI